MSLARVAAVSAVIVLTGCGRGAAPAPEATAPEAAAEPSIPAAPLSWGVQSSATERSALVHADPDGVEVLRIACRRDPADLFVLAPKLTRIGSEERVTLGAGTELLTLVASPDTPEGAPVQASGQLMPAFLEAVERGDRISVAYGAAQFGPLPSVPDVVRAAFVAGCRDASAPSATNG